MIPLLQQKIHGLNADVGIVEQRSIPIPNNRVEHNKIYTGNKSGGINLINFSGGAKVKRKLKIDIAFFVIWLFRKTTKK